MNDDFAFATRERLIPPVIEHTDEASIKAHRLNGPFAEIKLDFHLTPLVDGVDSQVVERVIALTGPGIFLR